MAKIKYPLTLEAKTAAKSLVAAWEDGKIDQYFEFIDVTTINAENRKLSLTLGGNGYADTDIPSLGIFLELNQFKLLVVTPHTEMIFNSTHRSYSVVLMQELRSAVANDFEVSDFFLTTQAVGTIINAAENSSVLFPGGFQSAASAFGDIDQTQINTVPELAAKLLEVLGKNTLNDNPELAKAIRELNTVEEPKRKLQFGKVFTELGNCLRHVATTYTVIHALLILASFAYKNNIF